MMDMSRMMEELPAETLLLSPSVMPVEITEDRDQLSTLQGNRLTKTVRKRTTGSSCDPDFNYHSGVDQKRRRIVTQRCAVYFPSDVWRLILSFMVRDEDIRDEPRALMKVAFRLTLTCSQWHSAFASSPDLWNSIWWVTGKCLGQHDAALQSWEGPWEDTTMFYSGEVHKRRVLELNRTSNFYRLFNKIDNRASPEVKRVTGTGAAKRTRIAHWADGEEEMGSIVRSMLQTPINRPVVPPTPGVACATCHAA